jgi:hypothetical protein
MAKAWMALLLMLSLGFCATTPLQLFINSTFEPDQVVEVKQVSGGSYQLITADGEETYVFDSQAGQAIGNREKMIDALSEEVKAASSFDSRVQSAKALSSAVKSAKQSDESQCMLLTGTDMHPCTDKLSCILACKSNPNCDIILYADGFWETLLDWSSKRVAFDSKLSSYSQGIDSVSSDPSAIDSKVAVLVELEYLSANISKNNIFLNRTDAECYLAGARCFEYCKKIDYSPARLSSERQSLLKLKGAVQSINSLPARADSILSAGRENDAYLSTRQKELRTLLVSCQDSISKLKKAVQGAQKLFDDPTLSSSLSELNSSCSKMSSLGKEGYYRKALAMGDGFEAGQQSLEKKISLSLSRRQSLEGKLSGFETKLGKSQGIIGQPSSDLYLRQWQEEKAKLSSPLSMQQISAIEENLEKMDGRLTGEIADKATSGAISIPLPSLPPEAQSSIPKGLPCAPAFILASLLLCVALIGKK